MQPRCFRDLHGVNHHRRIAVTSERVPVALVRGLRALWRVGVTADIDDCGNWTVPIDGKVQVRCHVDLRHALEGDLLDDVTVTLDHPEILNVQWRLRSIKRQTQHVLKFGEPLLADGLPSGAGRSFG